MFFYAQEAKTQPSATTMVVLSREQIVSAKRHFENDKELVEIKMTSGDKFYHHGTLEHFMLLICGGSNSIPLKNLWRGF